MLLYWRIFVTARTRLRKRLAQKAQVPVTTNNTSSSQKHKSSTTTQQQSLANDDDDSDSVNECQVVAVAKAQGKNGHQVETSFVKKQRNDSGVEEEEDDIGQECNGVKKGKCHKACKRVETHDELISVQNQGCQTDPIKTKRKDSRKANRGFRQCGSSLRRPRNKDKKHVSLEAKRERKAAKTLAIVTGAFIACWLPFFILALLMAIFKDWEFDTHLVSFFLWLGYFNSTLNPIIYTVFSPEFRQAFQRILFGKVTNQNHRPRHLQ